MVVSGALPFTVLPHSLCFEGAQSGYEEPQLQAHPLPISCGLPAGLGNRCALAKFVSGTFDLISCVSFLGPEESEREKIGCPPSSWSGKGVDV